MQNSLPIHIKLNEFEQALLEQIDFGSDPDSLVSRASGKASRQLMESLYRRNAIPAIRTRYFSSPFPGGRGKSHLEVFQSKLRRSKSHVFEDPSFVGDYLRYFIEGPDLSRNVIEGFCQIANSGDPAALCSFVREQIRNGGAANRRGMAEEFYKLALECFPKDSLTPARIRQAALRAR
jgi:hypothetical protein